MHEGDSTWRERDQTVWTMGEEGPAGSGVDRNLDVSVKLVLPIKGHVDQGTAVD